MQMPADLQSGMGGSAANCFVGARLGHHQRSTVQGAMLVRMENSGVGFLAYAQVVRNENNLLGHMHEKSLWCLSFMGPQILITGATGFIGRHLTRDLVRSGAKVRVLARDIQKAEALFGGMVDIIVGDLADDAALAQACRGVDILYHTAGVYRFGLRQGRVLWHSNVEGTEAILRAADRAGVSRVVHLSSGGVLEKPKNEPARLLDEKDFPSRAPRFSAYKHSKWEAERRVLTWAARGLPVMIAGTTCPIGDGDETPTPTGRLILDFIQGRFPFYCRAGLNFISVADLSRGLQQVATLGRVGERYLLSDQNVWLKDFLGMLALETGLRAPTTCLPGPLVTAIGGIGELVDLLKPCSRHARVCLETALQSSRVQFFSNAKARRELGFQPATPLNQSIQTALAWFYHEPGVMAENPTTESVQSHVG
jgi:dihydroflavonol-4-reductase